MNEGPSQHGIFPSWSRCDFLAQMDRFHVVERWIPRQDNVYQLEFDESREGAVQRDGSLSIVEETV